VPRGSPVTPGPGIIVHYSQRITQARHPAVTPTRTTVEETTLDLASAARTAEDAVAWILRAVASRRTTAERLAAVLRRRPRMRWRAEVTYALDPANSGVHSILEYRFVNRVERPHGLPPGTRQWLARRGGRRQYSDVAYEDYATLVELDGRAAHPESSRDLDTRRDNANVADDWVTLRYGWIEVSEHSCEIAAQLALTLRRRGWPGALRRCSASCRIPHQRYPPRSCRARPFPHHRLGHSRPPARHLRARHPRARRLRARYLRARYPPGASEAGARVPHHRLGLSGLPAEHPHPPSKAATRVPRSHPGPSRLPARRPTAPSQAPTRRKMAATPWRFGSSVGIGVLNEPLMGWQLRAAPSARCGWPQARGGRSVAGQWPRKASSSHQEP
jgi:hypothetical protein